MNRILIIDKFAFQIGTGDLLEFCKVAEKTPCGSILGINGPWKQASSIETQFTETELETIRKHIVYTKFEMPDNRLAELPSSEIEEKRRAALGISA